MRLPQRVKIVEVGPRDGLQSIRRSVPTALKIELIDRLAATGLKCIEAASFVAPLRVPQMADSLQVLQGIGRRPGVSYPVLVPNLRGLHDALQANISEIAIFVSASEPFSQHNLNCSIAESLQRYAAVCPEAKQRRLRVRGYISCVLGCPYQGRVTAADVAELAGRLWDLGCDEISLGDTIGVGTPKQAQSLIEVIQRQVPLERLAAHFHDTYGQALANVLAVLECGLSIVDSSVAGLGGCPFAPGASGNLATEDLLYMLQGLGIETGVDLDRLVEVGEFISQALQIPNGSKAATALLGRRQKP